MDVELIWLFVIFILLDYFPHDFSFILFILLFRVLFNSVEGFEVSNVSLYVINKHPIFRKEYFHLILSLELFLSSLLLDGLYSRVHHDEDFFQLLCVLLESPHDILGLNFDFVETVVIGHVSPF